MTRSKRLSAYPLENYELFDHILSSQSELTIPTESPSAAHNLRMSLYSFLKALESEQPAQCAKYRNGVAIAQEAQTILLRPRKLSEAAQLVARAVHAAKGDTEPTDTLAEHSKLFRKLWGPEQD